MTGSPAGILLDALGPGYPCPDPDELERALAATLADARAAWPEVTLGAERFAHQLADKLAQQAPAPIATLLPRLATADLYVAAACTDGDAAAITAVRGRLFADLDAVLYRQGLDATFIEEIKQRMLHVLFVARDGAAPRIASYAGRGDLRSWLRSVAVRLAFKQLAKDRRSPLRFEDDLGAVVDPGDDPEIAHLKATYAAEFNQALREAAETLSQRERLLLRFHHLDGLNVDELGAMYRVHRSTAARWVVAAREALFEETRLRLSARLGLGESELASLVRLVQSQLHLSLPSVLGEPPRRA